MGRARIAAPLVALGGGGGLAGAAELLDRCRGGRAEASDGRCLVGQVGQERSRIAVAVSVGQVTGDQQGQGGVVGGCAAGPSLAGGQLLDLAGSGVGLAPGALSHGMPSASPHAYAVRAPSMRAARSKTSSGYITHSRPYPMTCTDERASAPCWMARRSCPEASAALLRVTWRG